MRSMICGLWSVVGLYFVLSFAKEHSDEKVDERAWIQKWNLHGRHKLRHFHSHFHSHRTEPETSHFKKKDPHKRRSFHDETFPNLSQPKNSKDSKNKITCRDETQVHNDTENIICPTFAKILENVTQAIGREAKLECIVDNLGKFRVAWMRVETKAVLTLHRHVISPSYRITISHSEHRVYTLQIGHLQESDRGPYMCQVNTVPMLSQVVYLDVVVPPEIIEERTSSDMFAREGTDVTLTCAAKGRPAPKLIWRREDYKPILTGNWLDSQMQYNASVHEGSELTILKVSRLHMAAYLCIASNGVPPAMSRRIQLQVNFPPMIWIPNQLIGAALGQNVTIECHTEAHPDSINYWSRHESEIINTGPKFITHFNDSSYKVHMILIVHNVAHSDYGGYSCIARNFMGTTEGTIRLYENEAVYPNVFKDDVDEVPKDSKYSNTSIDIQDDIKVDSSCFRWRPSTMLILLSLTVIFVRACLDILGT